MRHNIVQCRSPAKYGSNQGGWEVLGINLASQRPWLRSVTNDTAHIESSPVHYEYLERPINDVDGQRIVCRSQGSQTLARCHCKLAQFYHQTETPLLRACGTTRTVLIADWYTEYLDKKVLSPSGINLPFINSQGDTTVINFLPYEARINRHRKRSLKLILYKIIYSFIYLYLSIQRGFYEF